MDNQAKILDIAMNLNRIGNWAADGFDDRKKRIYIFLDDTSQYLQSIKSNELSDQFKKTFESFMRDYETLEQSARVGPKDTLLWAERMMTWGNILTHRAKLA